MVYTASYIGPTAAAMNMQSADGTLIVSRRGD